MTLCSEATKHFQDAKTIIIKVGSNVLTDPHGGVNTKAIRNLVAGIAEYHTQKKQVILVSSGAVGCGKTATHFKKKRCSIPQKQALSAIGQIQLMHIYAAAFTKHNIIASQVLITHTSLKDRNQYRNLSNSLTALFDFGAIPIINENDALATEELSIGDNDTIASLIATRIGADMLILLTAVDGLLDSEGNTITSLKKINTREHDFTSAGPTSQFGTGGMESKLNAAKLAATNGTPVIIANGSTKNILQKISLSTAKGTFIHPSGKKLHGKKSWILAATSEKRGYITIDDGAVKAITAAGKSLLPAGVTKIHGTFKAGEVIKVFSQNKTLVAVGITNFNNSDSIKVYGKHSKEIPALLNGSIYDELIHRDNLVIIDR